MNHTFIDCNNETKTLDEFHLHELVDRIHCVQVMIQELLIDHPAGKLVNDKLKKASDALYEAYHQAADVRFNKFENKNSS